MPEHARRGDMSPEQVIPAELYDADRRATDSTVRAHAARTRITPAPRRATSMTSDHTPWWAMGPETITLADMSDPAYEHLVNRANGEPAWRL